MSCVKYHGGRCSNKNCTSDEKKECKGIYFKYKRICRIQKCKYPRKNLSFNKLIRQLDKLKYIKRDIRDCTYYRKKHSRKCIDRECIDVGHLMQIEQLNRGLYRCKQVDRYIKEQIQRQEDILE